jgi:NitT/TauT family transport system permease protein
VRAFTRGLLGIAGFLVLWELLGRSPFIPADALPPPSVVFGELVRQLTSPEFISHVVATVLALLIGSVPAIRHATRAVVEFLRPIPSVALIPLALVMLGFGPETKITLAVYAALWPILFNTIYALDELDPLLVDTARVFGTGRVGVLFLVALPSALPFVLTGIRLAATTALIVMVSVEIMAGSQIGLGYFIMEARSGPGRMDQVLVGTVVAGAIGVLLNNGLERVRRRWVAW